MKIEKKIVSILIILVIILSQLKLPVFATTNIVKTKVQETEHPKSPNVKVGSNTILMKKNYAVVKFKAKKSKYYRFTFSNIKNPNTESDTMGGYFCICRPYSLNTAESPYLKPQKVKVKGGRNSYINVANNEFLKYWDNNEATKNKYLNKRVAKIKLKKGETIYIYGCFAGWTDSKYNLKYTLKVK